MNIVIDTKAAESAGKELGKMLAEEKGRPVLLMLSGGSSLGILKCVPSDALSSELTVTMLDERYSSDSSASNFKQLSQTTFYRALDRVGAHFIDTRPQKDRRSTEATESFKKAVADWRREHPEGKIVITQGIGVDGHTAGILPFPEEEGRFRELFENGFAVEYSVPSSVNAYPHRLTVTFPFLREAVDVSIVYAAGGEKEDALRRVFAQQGALHRTPARILREMKRVTLFTPLTVVKI